MFGLRSIPVKAYGIPSSAAEVGLSCVAGDGNIVWVWWRPVPSPGSLAPAPSHLTFVPVHTGLNTGYECTVLCFILMFLNF